MNTPKYTFLLPAYKARFFAEALESIKKQTYKDFVCLVSDDCSPEDLKSIFDEIVGDDPRFTYRRNAENMGSKSLVSHWNLLVDMCDTEFLIMASDDDVYEPNFLEEIDTLTLKYPKVDLFRGGTKLIDSANNILKGDKRVKSFANFYEFVNDYFNCELIECIPNYVFRTKTIKSKKFIDFPLAWFSDQVTILNLSLNGCCHTTDNVFCFRLSGQNISSINNDRTIINKKIDATLKAMQWVKDFGCQNNITDLCSKCCKNWQSHLYKLLYDADIITMLKQLLKSERIEKNRIVDVLPIIKHHLKLIYKRCIA